MAGLVSPVSYSKLKQDAEQARRLLSLAHFVVWVIGCISSVQAMPLWRHACPNSLHCAHFVYEACRLRTA